MSHSWRKNNESRYLKFDFQHFWQQEAMTRDVQDVKRSGNDEHAGSYE